MHRRLTQAEVSDRFKENGVELIGIYRNSDIPVESRCLKCGYEWTPYPCHVFRNHACPKCGGSMRLSVSEVSERLLGVGIELIGDYVNTQKPVRVRCLECKYEWERVIRVKTCDVGCPKCVGLARLTQEEAENRFAAKNIKMLGEYRNSITHVLSVCLICGYEWMAHPTSVFINKGCIKCSGTLQITHDQANDRFLDKNLQILERYTNSKTSVLTMCKKCGYKWKVKPYHIFGETGCPQCAPYGFHAGKSGILYYIRINVIPPVYKIGISNNSVSWRFRSDIHKITIIDIKHFQNGEDARKEEREILKKNVAFRYQGPPLLLGGTKEMFYRDVLGLEGIRQKEFQFA